MKVAGARAPMRSYAEKAPFYSKAVIPGGTYKGNNNDVRDSCCRCALECHAQVFLKMFNTVMLKRLFRVNKAS